MTVKTRFLLTALVLALAGGTGGLIVAASGLYDVSAARGHWPITQRFLVFAMERSVAHHSRTLEVPPLDDPALVYLGLGHYDGACAPCHGAPGSPRNPVALGAVPKPPYLPDTVHQWQPEELFWITKRGLKYTGMPAFPAQQRDDEVWAVVAGMLELPRLSTEEYRRIVRGEPLSDLARVEEDARLLATAGPLGRDLVSCARCHGLRGEGRGEGAFPPLAGQREEYLYEALRGYALGSRQSGIMQPVATELTDTDMRDLARYFAGLPAAREAGRAGATAAPANPNANANAPGPAAPRPTPPVAGAAAAPATAPAPDASPVPAPSPPPAPSRAASGARPLPAPQPRAEALPEGVAAMRAALQGLPVPPPTAPARPSVDRGRVLARDGNPPRHVPACASCHGPGGTDRHPLYPSLAGLPRFYVEQQLRLFRGATHSATPQAEVMRAAARTLEEGEIRSLALYYSSLPRETAPPAAGVPAGGAP